MGLFTKIFGKPNKEADNQFEKEVEQIKAGKINKKYPILKPGDWIGIKAGCIKQTLLGKNCVRFYFLTNKGRFTAQEDLKSLENNSSKWLPFFEEANKLISELRISEEKK